MRTRALVLPILCMVVAAPSTAESDELRYLLRGNRHEGHKEVLISSAPALETLSFLRGSPELGVWRDGRITVRFFLRSPATVHIHARELVVHRFYEMRPTRTDWAGGWNSFEPWPVRDVIEKLGVRRENIAILGTSPAADSIEGLVPLVTERSLADGVNGAYYLVFRTRHDLRKADWTVRPAAGGASIREGSLRSVAGGTPATVRFDLKDAAEGYYHVLLDCRYENQGGGPQREYRFYHRPAVPAQFGGG